MNFLLPFATAITTAHINNAVVKLSAIGDIKEKVHRNDKNFSKIKTHIY